MIQWITAALKTAAVGYDPLLTNSIAAQASLIDQGIKTISIIPQI